MPTVRVVAQHLLDRRLQLGDLLVQMQHLPDEGADDQAPGGDGARTGSRAPCALLQQGNLRRSPAPVACLLATRSTASSAACASAAALG